MHNKSPHTFHIPVMGLAFTIDSPVKVARFGISSVISIVEDRLIEAMRGYYSDKFNIACQPIAANEPDYRAVRITAYLDLVNKIVKIQTDKLRTGSFETGTAIIKYFDLLPEEHSAKQLYLKMKNAKSRDIKQLMQSALRKLIVPGSIDVNIMTKPDKNNF